MSLRVTAASLVIVAVCATLVWRKAAGAPAPATRPPATAEQRESIGATVAIEERAWRTESESAFPDDHWSQRDDFAAREARRLRELAASTNVRVEDVLRAVDEDIHRSAAQGSLSRLPSTATPDPRGARVVPCKPRPFYD